MVAADLASVLNLPRFDLIFMVVRHPVSRIRSEYLYRNRTNKLLAMDEAAVEDWALRALAQYQANVQLWDNHVRPQVDFYLPGARIFHYENGLGNVVDMLNSDYDLGLSTDLTRNNADIIPGRSSRDVRISQRLNDKLEEFYAVDFDFFGYRESAAPPDAHEGLWSPNAELVSILSRRRNALTHREGSQSCGDGPLAAMRLEMDQMRTLLASQQSQLEEQQGKIRKLAGRIKVLERNRSGLLSRARRWVGRRV